MIKGIVIDVNNKDAVILADDGLFKKIKNNNYVIGQTLHINEAGKSKLIPALAQIAAVFAVGTIGAFAWFTPTDYVSMDVNPSIEYKVNMFDRILDVNAVNDDGAEILSGLNLNNKNIEVALRETLDRLIAEGYLTNDPDSGVVIATSNEKLKSAKKMAVSLEQEVQTYLEAREDLSVAVEVGVVRPEKVQEAKEMGVTPGKLHMVEKLQASTSGAINMEQWLNKPVKEINKEIKKNCEETGWDPSDPAQAAYSPYWSGNPDKSWYQTPGSSGTNPHLNWAQPQKQETEKDKDKDKDKDNDIDKDKDIENDKDKDKENDKDKEKENDKDKEKDSTFDWSRNWNKIPVKKEETERTTATSVTSQEKAQNNKNINKNQDKEEEQEQAKNNNWNWNQNQNQNWNWNQNQYQNWNWNQNQNQNTGRTGNSDNDNDDDDDDDDDHDGSRNKKSGR